MLSEADETITYNNPGLKESGLLIIDKMAKIKSDYRIIAIKDIWMLHQMNDMDGREYTTVDSVIPESYDYELDEVLLLAMKEYWF